MPLSLLAHGDLHLRIAKLSKGITESAAPNIFVKRGRLWHDDKSFEMALLDFKQALSLDPNHANALYYGAKTLLQLDNHKQAEIFANRFNHLMQNASNAARSRSFQLLAEIAVKKNALEIAILYQQKSLALLAQPAPDMWLKLSELQLQQSGFNIALATLQQALLRSPNSVLILNKLVEISLKYKAYDLSFEYLEQQLDKSGSIRKVILLLKKSEVLQLKGALQASEKTRQQAISSFRQLPTGRQNQPAGIRVKKQLNL